MNCPYCNNPLLENSKFCTSCGAKLTPAQPAQQPAKKKKPVWLFILLAILGVGLVGLALVVVLVVGAIFLVNRPAESGPVIAETAPTQQVEAVMPDGPTVSPDNAYHDCYVNYGGGFVLRASDSIYYTRADIDCLTDAEREIARQEIYARNGRTFSDRDLREYFEAQPWYHPGSEESLNDCEKDNLFLLDTYEQELSGEIRSNRYIRHLPSANDYSMAGSDSRYLRASDLSNLEHDRLVVIRNEIFARHGYIFGSEALKAYFYCTDWYQPDPNFSKNSFNKYEKANVELCDQYERKLEGVTFSSKNPYARYFWDGTSYMISYSSSQYLQDYDLMYLDKYQLVIARNEILARHGYTFESENLQEYFLQCSWYNPDTPPGDTSSLKLSKIETHNINMLKEYEKYAGDEVNMDFN